MSYTTPILLTLLLVSSAYAITFSVEPHQEECFFEEVEAGQKITTAFQVATGGFLDIDVKITGPDDKIIYSGERETEGKYTFVAQQTGSFHFCFGNAMSTVTAKTVSLNVHIGDAPENSEVATQNNLGPLEQVVLQLSESLANVQNEQRYLRSRERVHRNTSESTNARVLWWTFFEAAVLVLTSLWQITYIRKFFERRTPV